MRNVVKKLIVKNIRQFTKLKKITKDEIICEYENEEFVMSFNGIEVMVLKILGDYDIARDDIIANIATIYIRIKIEEYVKAKNEFKQKAKQTHAVLKQMLEDIASILKEIE